MDDAVRHRSGARSWGCADAAGADTARSGSRLGIITFAPFAPSGRSFGELVGHRWQKGGLRRMWPCGEGHPFKS